MNHNEIKAIDRIERLIITALEMNHTPPPDREILHLNRKGDGYGTLDIGAKVLKYIENKSPESCYTFDGIDSGRLFSPDRGWLINSPQDILGNDSEILMLGNPAENIPSKWGRIIKLKSAPRGVIPTGKVSDWYVYHYRQMFENGMGEYGKRLLALDKNGYPVSVMLYGSAHGSKFLPICDVEKEGIGGIMMCSMIEDAHRTDAMLATVSDAITLKLPVPVKDYKELFSKRVAPTTKTGRRRPILHWVAEHMRMSSKGNDHNVCEHPRGVKDINVDGINISIEFNNWEHD